MHIIHGAWLGNNGDRGCDPRVGARLHGMSNGKFASLLLGTVGGQKRKKTLFFSTKSSLGTWEHIPDHRPPTTGHCPRDRASPTTWH